MTVDVNAVTLTLSARSLMESSLLFIEGGLSCRSKSKRFGKPVLKLGL